MLRNEGWGVNHKRVERIWRLEGLKVPQKQPKRGRLWLNDGSCVRLRPERRDHVWAYDFVQGRTHDGRALPMPAAAAPAASPVDAPGPARSHEPPARERPGGSRS